MKKLRIIRIVLAAAFLVASVLCFVLGREAQPRVIAGAVAGAERLQIEPLYFAESAGVILVWLIITLVWGRIYCSTVCPVGALADVMLHLRRRIPALNKPFSYSKPRRIRYHLLLVYAVSLAMGLTVVPLVFDPWFVMGNMLQPFGGKISALWVKCGYSALWGMIWGVESVIILLPWALLRGREFCNTVCPVGTVLGYVSRRSAFRINIDGDRCISCMKCQDNCRSSCIKVAERYVDNGRCVKCFECVAHCPQNAIRYTQERRRPASPLFGGVRKGMKGAEGA